MASTPTPPGAEHRALLLSLTRIGRVNVFPLVDVGANAPRQDFGDDQRDEVQARRAYDVVTYH